MENEAKKEVFKKYLESTGVLDALTKVLVALYEQNNKPSSAIEFIQQKLGGPTVSEYERLQAEMADLQVKHNQQKTEMSDLQLNYDKLLTAHQEVCSELDELKRSHHASSSKEAAEEAASTVEQ